MKQSKQENLIYLAVWGMLFAAPLLSLYVRTMNDSNLMFDWTEVFLVWRKFALYLLLFLVVTTYNVINAAILHFGGPEGSVPLGVGPILFGVFTTAWDTSPSPSPCAYSR